jgi:hypothetical protein
VVRIRTFEQWLTSAGPAGLTVFTIPLVATRAIGADLGLPDLSANPTPTRSVSEGDDSSSLTLRVGVTTPQGADGLEWLMRLGVLWQQVAGAPLRRTQQGGFFKRDLERLEQDPLLNGPPADRLADVPALGFLLAGWAQIAGIVREEDGELRAGTLPAAWDAGLAPALESLWVDLFRLNSWNPVDGWAGPEAPPGNPFLSAYLLAFLLLAEAQPRSGVAGLPENGWIRPDVVQEWLHQHHPYWSPQSGSRPRLSVVRRPLDSHPNDPRGKPVGLPLPQACPVEAHVGRLKDDGQRTTDRPWLETFLLGVAYQMRLVQVARDPAENRLVRLTPLARWLLGLGEAPPAPVGYPQTLLVQPNLEIIAYRQGLTPSLIARLTRFARWKTLGAACTLQFEPETVYRALESGESFESICQTIEQHGTRAIPPAVLDLLRTWSNKRDRITVYPSAVLLEFTSAADLNEALARGLPGMRVSDTLAVVASEDGIDFRHFRLTGTRDYSLPPEKCVTVEPDGITLAVDLARSDLLLETELTRFAEGLDRRTPTRSVSEGATTRLYRLTPVSLASARSSGTSVAALEAWFMQRTGQSLPPAARLLLVGAQVSAPQLRRHLVLHVASPELADGLMQWPQTRALIESRLGPTALSVTEEQLGALRACLATAGITLAGP